MSGAASASASAPSPRRIVVLGGNGFVGSHVCQELLARKARGKDGELTVTSVSRSGLPPKGAAPWVRDVQWLKGDPSSPNAGDLPAALQGAAAVISTIGGFGNREAMVRQNGATNVAAIDAAKAKGVPRFVYISAHHYGLPEMLKRGYFEGKLMTEKALADKYKEQGVAVRPGFIFLVTNIGFVRSLSNLPVLGPVLAPVLLPPVSVQAVAKAAVDAALARPKPEKSVIEVDDILRAEA